MRPPPVTSPQPPDPLLQPPPSSATHLQHWHSFPGRGRDLPRGCLRRRPAAARHAPRAVPRAHTARRHLLQGALREAVPRELAVPTAGGCGQSRARGCVRCVYRSARDRVGELEPAVRGAAAHRPQRRSAVLPSVQVLRSDETAAPPRPQRLCRTSRALGFASG